MASEASDEVDAEPSFLEHVELSVDLLEDHWRRLNVRYERKDDQLIGRWKEYTLMARVVNGPLLALRAELNRRFPVSVHLSVVERCNDWNATRIGPKASAIVRVYRAESGDEATASSVEVSLAVELEVPFGVGLNRLQLNDIFGWFERGVGGFVDRVNTTFTVLEAAPTQPPVIG